MNSCLSWLKKLLNTCRKVISRWPRSQTISLSRSQCHWAIEGIWTLLFALKRWRESRLPWVAHWPNTPCLVEQEDTNMLVDDEEEGRARIRDLAADATERRHLGTPALSDSGNEEMLMQKVLYGYPWRLLQDAGLTGLLKLRVQSLELTQLRCPHSSGSTWSKSSRERGKGGNSRCAMNTSQQLINLGSRLCIRLRACHHRRIGEGRSAFLHVISREAAWGIVKDVNGSKLSFRIWV